MSVLKKADELINGQRANLYGPPGIGWGVVAKLWSGLLGVEVTTKQALLMMVLLKVSRENEKQDEDNLIDGAGYFGVIEKLLRDEKPYHYTYCATNFGPEPCNCKEER